MLHLEDCLGWPESLKTGDKVNRLHLVGCYEALVCKDWVQGVLWQLLGTLDRLGRRGHARAVVLLVGVECDTVESLLERFTAQDKGKGRAV